MKSWRKKVKYSKTIENMSISFVGKGDKQELQSDSKKMISFYIYVDKLLKYSTV